MKDILVLNLPQCLKTFYISSRKKDESNTSTVEDLSTQYITEKEYYNLLEVFLENNKLNINDKNINKSTTTNNNNFEKKYKSLEDVDYCNVYKTNLNKKDNLKILNYHIQNIMCGGWIFDHEAHMKYSYYPSNVFPIGSNLEYMYFMRPWSRNVNNLYVNRLYKKYPDFNKLLEKIKNCPCNFLLQFNILNKDLYMYTDNTGNDLMDVDNDADDVGCNGGNTINMDKNIDNKMEICNNYTVDNNDDSNILYKISVDNELMMKSDFFLKKKYVHFNIWLYENLIKNNKLNKEFSYCVQNSKDNIKSNNFNEEILISVNENSKPLRLDEKVWFKYKIHQNKLEKQLINKLNKPKKNKFNGISNKQMIRLSAMKSILENIYFKNDLRENNDDDDDGKKNNNNKINMSTENMSVNYNKDVDIKTLVRCENHNSKLYSPVLKLTDCKHLEESVYFVQRRSGDEISTEIRKCKECGNVKIL